MIAAAIQVIKANKAIAGIASLVAIIGGLYSLKVAYDKSLLEQCAANYKVELTKQLEDARKAEAERYKEKLANFKLTIIADKNAEIERLKESKTIETVTETVIEYVDREIKVTESCTDLASSVVDSLRESAKIAGGGGNATNRR